MKKSLFILIMILGVVGYSQSLKKYGRTVEMTTAEIMAIDTARTGVVYDAYNTDLNIYVINRRDDAGWVPLVTSGGGATYTAGSGININGSDVISVDGVLTDSQTLSIGGADNRLYISDGNNLLLPTLANANQIITDNRTVKIDGISKSIKFTDSYDGVIFEFGNTSSAEKFFTIPFAFTMGQGGLSFLNPFLLYSSSFDPSQDTEGSIYYNTTEGLKISDGTTYNVVGSGGGTDNQTAAEVTIADVGSLITATTVESALQENRTAIDLNTAKENEGTTVTDTGEIDLTLSTLDITADIIAGSIDETKLDASTNSSLDLADSALQSDATEVTGSDAITNIISMTQAEFDANAPDATTFSIITDAAPSTVVTSATVDLDESKLMYNDQTADAGTLTFNNAKAGGSITVFINRSAAPTLAGSGITFNQVPNTTAFASGTEMAIYFEAIYDGTTIDYYYYER
ncbi:hypothetical protein [Maribacter sp. ACAM166]|uniref:hypothetical protein n=1 Tax=Maribacter sp. ACAM166 TaxID=2508996 RepID=UPI0010FDFF2B|nr:hypothetical protein [Maribacter sp. ACAM166]TLP81346.1 hypothetical protein ES765_04890 [Maribacter sp. ACAM166]